MHACDICGGRLIEKVGDYETSYRAADGSIRPLVVPDVRTVYCESCKEEYLDQQSLEAIEAAQRVAIGRLTPDQLRTWRHALNKSQTELSSLLGFGLKTYARWESGAYTMSASADRYLRLVMAFPEALLFLEDLSSGTQGITLHAGADVIQNFDFDALDAEFKDLFNTGDPAVRISEIFSAEFTAGRVFER